MVTRWLFRKTKKRAQNSLLSRDWHIAIRGQTIKNIICIIEKSFTTVMIYQTGLRGTAVVKEISDESKKYYAVSLT